MSTTLATVVFITGNKRVREDSMVFNQPPSCVCMFVRCMFVRCFQMQSNTGGGMKGSGFVHHARNCGISSRMRRLERTVYETHHHCRM